jgi:hypothetical protein
MEQRDGSIDITAAGGTPIYTYSWTSPDGGTGLDPTAEDQTGLSAGTYIVVVTDSEGCTGSAQFDLDQPDPILFDSTYADPDCHENSTPAQNGFITISNVTGGTGTYSFSWTGPGVSASSQSQAGLGGGTYNVTVTDANGCTATAEFVLDEPTEVVVEGTATDLTCHEENAPVDGTITLTTVTGGTEAGVYDFSWTASNGGVIPAGQENNQDLTGLSAGTYTVTVTDDNGCTDTAQFTLTQPDPMVIAASTQDLDCNADNGAPIGAITITSTLGGTPPYTYNWTGPGGFTSTSRDLTGLEAGTYYLTVTDATGVGCELLDTFDLTEPDPIVFSLDPTDPECHTDNTNQVNGTINIIGLTGGTPPYTFNWAGSTGTVGIIAADQNQSNLGEGTYYVTVTDAAGCTRLDTVALDEPDRISVLATIIDLDCHADNGAPNGSITLVVSGGTVAPASDYVYAWTASNGGVIPAGQEDDQSLTGLTAGTYSVSITDDNGCFFLADYEVTQPDSLVINGTPTDLACNALSGDPDGEIVIDSVTGGTPEYTYAWTATSGGPIPAGQENTDSLFNLPIGTYSLTVTDANGCTETAEFIIDGPTPVVVQDSVVTDLSCHADNGAADGSIDITAAGGTPAYTYSWTSPDGGTGLDPTAEDQTGLSAGTYIVVVTDSEGCTGSAQFDLDQPDPILFDSTYTDPLCHENSTPAQDGTITISNVTGGTGAYTYAWTGPGVNATSQSQTGLGGGTYNLTVTDANGCTATAEFTLDEPTEVEVAGTATDLTCHEENAPVDGTITLTTVQGGTEAGSYDFSWSASNGGVIPAGQENNQDLTGLSAGTYTVTVTDDNGCTDTAQFTLTQPDPIVIATSTQDLDCNANNGAPIGEITILSTVGGTGPYTYNWVGPNGFTSTNEDLTGLEAGTYYLTVTDATGIGCELLDTFDLTEPDPILFSLDPTDPSCHTDNTNQVDGTITMVGLTGGTPPYTYNWAGSTGTVGIIAGDQNQSNLGEGTYYVTVTDAAGCTRLDTVELVEPDRISVLATIDDLDCHANNGAPNGSITLVVSGGTVAPASDYVFAWTASNGGVIPAGQEDDQNLTGLTAGTYSVSITDDNGCFFLADYDVDQPDSLDIDGVTVDLTCNAGNAAGDGSITLTVTGGTNPYTYAWTATNGGTIQAGEENDPAIDSLTAGDYTVVVTDANGCTDSATYTLGEPTTVTCSIAEPPTNACGNHIACNGDSIDITASAIGGNGPYTYSIDGTSFGPDSTFSVGAGTHTITVRDVNGCESTCEMVITEPDPLVAGTCVPEMDDCQVGAGEIQVEVSGGCPPYTISYVASPDNPLDQPSPQVISTPDTDGNYIFLFTGAMGNTTYTFTVTDANGCVLN